jgi:hypothetical protein
MEHIQQLLEILKLKHQTEKFDTGSIGPNQKSKPATMATEPGSYNYFCTRTGVTSQQLS